MEKPLEFKYNDVATFKNALEKILNADIEIEFTKSPYPIEICANHSKGSVIPLYGTIAGLAGFILSFLFQMWVALKAYPMHFGGKPLLAIPSFIIVSFECAILFSAITMVIIFLMNTYRKRNDYKSDEAHNYIIVLKQDNKTLERLKNLDIS